VGTDVSCGEPKIRQYKQYTSWWDKQITANGARPD